MADEASRISQQYQYQYHQCTSAYFSSSSLTTTTSELLQYEERTSSCWRGCWAVRGAARAAAGCLPRAALPPPPLAPCCFPPARALPSGGGAPWYQQGGARAARQPWPTVAASSHPPHVSWLPGCGSSSAAGSCPRRLSYLWSFVLESKFLFPRSCLVAAWLLRSYWLVWFSAPAPPPFLSTTRQDQPRTTATTKRIVLRSTAY